MTRERGRMRLPSLHGLFQKVRLWNVLHKALRRLWQARPVPQAWGFCKPDRRVSQKKATLLLRKKIPVKSPPSPAGQRQRIKAPLSCSPSAFPLILRPPSLSSSSLLLSPPPPPASRLPSSGASLQPHTTSPAPVKHQLPLQRLRAFAPSVPSAWNSFPLLLPWTLV